MAPPGKTRKACRGRQTVKKVPSSRHVRMDGTHTGKFGAESVRAALRRVHGSALNFVPRGIPGGKNFCRATARRNGFPLERGAFATRWNAPFLSAQAEGRGALLRLRLGGHVFGGNDGHPGAGRWW